MTLLDIASFTREDYQIGSVRYVVFLQILSYQTFVYKGQ